MTWFKTDDRFHDHRKARAVRRSHPTKVRDASPLGLWVLAGSWSDDGFVPLEVLEDWDDDAAALAQRLVDAGLWRPVTQAGEQGYEFHDWSDYLPKPDGIEDASESGRRGNHVRWHVTRNRHDPTCEFCDPSIGANRGDDRGDASGVVAPESGRVSRSRPDPNPTRTRPEPDPTEQPLLDESSETDDRFEEFWEAYDHKVGRKKAEVAYRAALKKPGITPELLIAAAASYIAWVKRDGKHPTYTKHPTTWLHGEHWRDERITPTQPLTRVQQHLALAQQLAQQEQGATIHEIGGSR